MEHNKTLKRQRTVEEHNRLLAIQNKLMGLLCEAQDQDLTRITKILVKKLCINHCLLVNFWDEK